ncbi:hypothetical protein RS030_4522 [Cryptosporidium xiaoi]|uniref:Uncharacterized protein n=1 Tax=Cryptosporidium xiaoi TaxID=659607 RepID=A0AAV9XWN5_9CRYT
MGNLICTEFLLYKKVDICLVVDNNDNLELLNNIMEDDMFSDKISVLERKNKDLKNCEDGFGKKIVFARLEIDDFKILFENYIKDNKNMFLRVVGNGVGNEVNIKNLIKTYHGINIESLVDRLIISNSVIDSKNIINSMVQLIKNYDINDYLECYITNSEFKRTLGYYNCLDNCDIYKKNLNDDKLQVNNVTFINIEKESTKYYHINSTEDNKLELMGVLDIGEYTFLGLYRTIDANISLNLSDITDSIQEGNIEICDLLVKDIYGQSYMEANLNENVVASSLGKLQFINSEQKSSISSKDLLKSITILLSTSIIQKGLIHSQITNKKNIIISGFVTNFPKIMASIYNTLRVLSNNEINVYFLKSEINLSLIDI